MKPGSDDLCQTDPSSVWPSVLLYYPPALALEPTRWLFPEKN